MSLRSPRRRSWASTPSSSARGRRSRATIARRSSTTRRQWSRATSRAIAGSMRASAGRCSRRSTASTTRRRRRSGSASRAGPDLRRNSRRSRQRWRVENELASASLRERALSPQFGRGRLDAAALIDEAVFAVAGQQQRAVEIDQRASGASSSAGAMASEVATMQPTMIPKPAACAAAAQRQRLGQPAGLVELDVDGVVAAGEAGEARPVVAGFVGADRHRPRQAGQRARRRRPAAAARSARRRARASCGRQRGVDLPASSPRWRRRSGARRGAFSRTARTRSRSPAPPSLSFSSGRSALARAAARHRSRRVSRLSV